MSDFVGAGYDETPYPAFAFPLTHPDHLAAFGLFHGILTAPVRACRVLELGCASGGNLIPMAYGLPDSHFVGVDISPEQIASARRWAGTLGLRNIELMCCDLLRLDESLGRFDYIIAHGVYSWVPEAVRDGLLALCRRLLAPQGIAYISYNTYPGWRPLQALREGLIHLTRHSASAGERAALARATLAQLGAATTSVNAPYDTALHGYSRFELRLVEQLGPAGDAYLSHDLLETVNNPCTFTAFAGHARRHGLQFVTEAEFAATCTSNLAPEFQPLLASLASDLVRREQLIDTVRARAFRMSLLCHDRIKLDRSLSPEKLRRLHIAAQVRPLGEHSDLRAPAALRFEGPEGLRFKVGHPLSKAALVELARSWPQALPFEGLVEAAARRLGPGEEPAGADLAVLGRTLLMLLCLQPSPLSLHTAARPFALVAGERPRASAVARLQARDGSLVTTLSHSQVGLDAQSRALLPLLDGSRTRAELRAQLAKPGAEPDIATASLEETLARLGRQALLELEGEGEPTNQP